MRRRILTIFLVIIVILGIGSYLLWQQDLLSKKVKDGIVDLLAERLGLEMTVDRVKGGLLNEIILIDVSLRNPEKIEEEINIQQISLRYNLWKIITQREDISGIQRIEFVRPILLVSRNKEGRWSWQEPIEYLFKGEKRDYLPRILVKDAQIDFLDELTGNRIRFNKVNSSVSEDLSTLKLKDGEISLSKRDKPLRGVSLHLSWSKERLFVGGFSLKPHQIEIFFKGEIPNPEEKRVQFELVTNTFSLKKTKDLFAEREIKDYLGGLDLKGQFRFKGELKYPEEKGLLCNGEMVFTGEGVPSLFARISYQGERLSLSPLTIDDRGSELMGDIDLRDASVDLKLTASRLDIQALSVFVPRKIKWPYLMDGEVKIAGPIKDPLIESRVRFIPDNPKSKIRDIVVVLLRKEGEFRLRSLQIHHQKGTRFSLEGILTKGRTEEFYDVNLDGDLSLPLAEHSLSSRIGFRGEITLFEPSKDHSKVGEAAYDSRRRRKWNLLASRKGMSLEGEEDLLSPYLTGELRLAELCVGGERLGSFTYRIEYQRKGLKISTPSPDSSACLSGRIDFSPLKVNLDVKSNKLALKPLSVWSGLKGIDGQVSGMVTIKAEPGQKPRVEGKGIEIAMPKFLGGSSGTISFASQGEMVEILEVELKDKDGGRLNTLGKIWLNKKPSLHLVTDWQTLQMKGGFLARGSLETKGRMDDLRLNGSLDFVKEGSTLSIEKIEGRLAINRKKVIVHTLSARLGEKGRASAHGVYSLGGQDGEIDFHLKGLRWQEMPQAKDYFKAWEGEIELSGRLRGTPEGLDLLAYLGPLSVKIEDEELKEFKGELTYQSGKVKIILNPTPRLLVKGEVIPSDSKVNLKTEIKRERTSILSKLLPFSLGQLDGEIQGVVMIEEGWENPLVKGNLSIETFPVAQQKPIHIKIKFLVKDKIFSTETFHIQQPVGHLTINECRIGPLPAGEVKLLAELVDFRLPGVNLTGLVGFEGIFKSGSLVVEGEIHSDSLWLNRRFEIKDLATRCQYESGKGIRLLPLEVQSSFSGMIGTSEGRVTVEKVKIWRGGKDLACLEGYLDLEGRVVSLEMVMDRLDLGLLCQHIEPIERIEEGYGQGWVRLNGPFDNLRLEGEMNTQAKRVRALYLADEVKNFEAKIIIRNNLLAIEHLSAEAGKTKLKASSKKISPKEVDFFIQTGGEPLRVNIPEFVQGEIKSKLRFTGSFSDLRCSGEIELYRTRLTYPPPKGGMEVLRTKSFDPIELDLKLIAKKNVAYYNEFVDVPIKDGSWISFKGKGPNRRIGGLAWSRPNRGKILFLGREFLLQEAELRFEEDFDSPFLFGTARTKAGDIDIYLTHNGRLFEAEPVLSTPDLHPPKSEKEIVGLLQFGRAYPGMSEEDSRVLLQIGMLRLANIQLSTNLIHPLERRLSTLLNIDVGIKTAIIDKVLADAAGSEGKAPSSKDPHPLAETEINLGKYITEYLYLKYQAKLLESSDKEKGLAIGHGLGLEYHLPGEESIQIEFRPNGTSQEEEHKIMLRKEILFP